jgi:hypothetical protein
MPDRVTDRVIVKMHGARQLLQFAAKRRHPRRSARWKEIFDRRRGNIRSMPATTAMARALQPVCFGCPIAFDMVRSLLRTGLGA